MDVPAVVAPERRLDLDAQPEMPEELLEHLDSLLRLVLPGGVEDSRQTPGLQPHRHEFRIRSPDNSPANIFSRSAFGNHEMEISPCSRSYGFLTNLVRRALRFFRGRGRQSFQTSASHGSAGAGDRASNGLPTDSQYWSNDGNYFRRARSGVVSESRDFSCCGTSSSGHQWSPRHKPWMRSILPAQKKAFRFGGRLSVVCQDKP